MAAYRHSSGLTAIALTRWRRRCSPRTTADCFTSAGPGGRARPAPRRGNQLRRRPARRRGIGAADPVRWHAAAASSIPPSARPAAPPPRRSRTVAGGARRSPRGARGLKRRLPVREEPGHRRTPRQRHPGCWPPPRNPSTTTPGTRRRSPCRSAPSLGIPFRPGNGRGINRARSPPGRGCPPCGD